MYKEICKTFLFAILLGGVVLTAAAQNDTTTKSQRLTIGGYGEAVYNYNF